MKKITNKTLIVVILLFFIAGCTKRTFRNKVPVFTVENSQIQEDLGKIISCEAIHIEGNEITVNEDKHSEMKIEIVNAVNMPEDWDKITDLGKLIAKQLKQSLKEKNEFDIYRVVFMTKSKSGSFTKTLTREMAINSGDL